MSDLRNQFPLTGTASMALLPFVSFAAMALTAASGWLFATLWQRDRGAWSAVGAHAMWGLLTGALLRGGLLDVVFVDGSLALGPRAAGAPAGIATAIAILASVIVPRLPGFRRARA